MITMINFPSDSPKEFYGSKSSEGRFYFPSRYRKHSKKDKKEEKKEGKVEKVEITEAQRKSSEDLWNGILLNKMVFKMKCDEQEVEKKEEEKEKHD